MRIPQNKIISNQVTSGKELMSKNTQQEYIGNYYIVGNQYFAGSTFTTNPTELVKITNENINVLKAQSSTFNFGQINTNNSLASLLSTVEPPNITYKITSNDVNQGFVTRYFCKQLNKYPISIKEIDVDNYNRLQDVSLYQVVSLNYYLLQHDTIPGNFLEDDLIKADSKMSGLAVFLTS